MFLAKRMSKSMGGGSGGILGIGSSKKMINSEKPNVKFEDMAGNQEAKEEVQEVVDFLSAPDRYIKLGAQIPKGVLLVGPPGTGKTLLAKAVAGEADVEFLSVSGSAFIEMFVGVGASRVRDLFEQAKKKLLLQLSLSMRLMQLVRVEQVVVQWVEMMKENKLLINF